MTSDVEARVGLCALRGLGAPSLVAAVARFGAVEVWEGLLREGESTRFGRLAMGVDLPGIMSATSRCGSRFISPDSPEWPSSLDGLGAVSVGGQAGVPFGLWVKGSSLDACVGAVAVVGARACTRYGELTAAEFSADLAVAGRTIVSGLAFGIDAASHRGALGGGGRTVAVVASGLDRPYPVANTLLSEAIAKSGTLVTELPPGSLPARGAFLARNRIIAGLADAVVVVEAGLRSGAKNTATWAAALGRPVFAVPGPVTSALSMTPHRLIRDGEATLVRCAADIEQDLAPIGVVPEPSSRGAFRSIDGLPVEWRELREAIGVGESLSVSQLAARTGQRVAEVLSGTAELVERGWLDSVGGSFALPGRP